MVYNLSCIRRIEAMVMMSTSSTHSHLLLLNLLLGAACDCIALVDLF